MAAVPQAIAQLNDQVVAQQHAMLPSVQPGFGSLQSFELMQRAAKLMAASSLMPAEFQNNLPNCVIALNMAQRMGADPLMVAQNLYVVHGRPGWSAQFLIACFNQCGRFSAIRYEFFGEKGKPSWGCRAWATELATKGRIVSSDITIELAHAEGWYDKKGSKWKTMPQHMMMLRAAAWLVRTHAPEIAMGLQTSEELHDVIDMEPAAPIVAPAIAALNDGLAITAQKQPEPTPAETPKAELPTFEDLAAGISVASSAEALQELANRISTIDKPEDREELEGMVEVRRAELAQATTE